MHQALGNVLRRNVDISQCMEEVYEVLVDKQQGHGKEKADKVINALSKVIFKANAFGETVRNMKECECVSTKTVEEHFKEEDFMKPDLYLGDNCTSTECILYKRYVTDVIKQ